MEGTPALYKGKLVRKAGFRTFIYAPDGSQKLVNSWEEFEAHMQTGLWFAEKNANIPVVKETQEIQEIPLIKIEKPKKRKGK
jgi:hypothetical protein